MGGAADDPFVMLPSPRVSFRRMTQIVNFVCISLEILLGAFEIIKGFTAGWIYVCMLVILLAWVDFQIAVYYRNNLIRMLTVQGFIIMAVLLLIARLTRSGSWAVTWAVPSMFLVLIIVTFAAARLQQMKLQEFILYPAFDVLMSLLQIIPIALGYSEMLPQNICICNRKKSAFSTTPSLQITKLLFLAIIIINNYHYLAKNIEGCCRTNGARQETHG